MSHLFVLILYSQSRIERVEQAITAKDYKLSNEIANGLIGSEISTERSVGYWALGVSYLSKNPDSANYFLQRALDENPDDLLKLKIINAQANYFDITGSTKEAIKLFLRATDLAVEHDSSFLSGISNNLSIAYRSLGMFDSAVHYGFEGLRHAQMLEQSYEEKRLYNSIAIAFAIQNNLEVAATYFKRSLAVALSNNDSTGASKGYVNLTQLKIYNEEIDSAKYFLSLAETYNSHNRNALDIMDMYALLAEVELSENNLDDALSLLKKAIASIKGLGYPIEKVDLHLELTRVYLKQNDFQKSQLNLESAKSLIDASDVKTRDLAIAKLQKDIYKATGSYKNALNMDALIDSLTTIRFDTQKSKAVEEIKTKYETEKKEQLITTLEQEAEISELKISQQYTLLIGAGLSLVILVLVGIVISRNRSLAHGKQRLLIEQKLLRSQMNPHFLFNALASIHSFVLKGDKREASDYLSTFSELTRDILDYSSREWVTLDKELQTLGKYLEVQRLRFPTISTTIKVGEDIDSSNVLFPPLLLQPFVENAFEHGFNGQDTGSFHLEIQEKEQKLIIELRDDGVGLQSNHSSHESRAIEIAKERLALLFGKDNTQLSIEDRQDRKGVLVTIVIPKEEAL